MNMDLQKDIVDIETENRRCETCAYHDDWTWVCFNPEAYDRADFTNPEHECDCWSSREDNNNGIRK